MTTDRKDETWVKRYKLDYVTFKPVEVEVLLLKDGWCVERGASNSSWTGNYYATPADAYVAAFAEQHRRESELAIRANRLTRAHDNYLREVEGRVEYG